MQPTLTDNILIIIYFLFWLVVFILYHRNDWQLDAGSAIIGSYVCYALFSIISLNQPVLSWIDYYDYNHLKLFPFIYLAVMLIMALSPTIRFHFHPARQIEEPTSMAFYIIAVVFILSALALLPSLSMNLGDGLFKLMTDMDAGKDAYEEQLNNASESGGGISNIPAILFNALTEIAVFTFFYFLSKKKNIWLVSGLGFSIAISVIQPIMTGQRSLVIYTVFTVVVGYFFFKRYLSDTIKRIVRYVGIFALLITMVPIVAITVSRFSQTRQSTVMDYVNWYIGQENIYFNNYALDDNGIRYGDRTLNLVKRVISSDASQNYVERRSIYSNLYVNDDIFTTFVGDFAIDYGPALAFLIFVVFNLWVLYATKVRNKTFKIQQALLLFFTMCVCMQGGMTLFTFADTANLKMFVFFILYAYLNLYDNIVEKYPQQIEIVKHTGKSLPKKKIVLKSSR